MTTQAAVISTMTGSGPESASQALPATGEIEQGVAVVMTTIRAHEWRMFHLFATIIGLGAVISYAIVWYIVFRSGGTAIFLPATIFLETVIEPMLLIVFTTTVAASMVKQIQEFRADR